MKFLATKARTEVEINTMNGIIELLSGKLEISGGAEEQDTNA